MVSVNGLTYIAAIFVSDTDQSDLGRSEEIIAIVQPEHLYLSRELTDFERAMQPLRVCIQYTIYQLCSCNSRYQDFLICMPLKGSYL